MELLGNLERGKTFVVSAPAGTGKTTLVSRLCKEFSCVQETVSFTTRTPRQGEVDGRHYHFVSRQDFERRKAAGEFLESAEVFSNGYGTSRLELEKKLSEGLHMVLVIDTQGAVQLMEQGLDARYIFVEPPSLEELRRRLLKRRTESPEKMAERLSWAEKEIALGTRYDYRIVNDDLDIAYEVLRSIVIAEEHRLPVKPVN